MQNVYMNQIKIFPFLTDGGSSNVMERTLHNKTWIYSYLCCLLTMGTCAHHFLSLSCRRICLLNRRICLMRLLGEWSLNESKYVKIPSRKIYFGTKILHIEFIGNSRQQYSSSPYDDIALYFKPVITRSILRFPWGTVTHIVPPCQLGPCCTLIYWPNIPGIVFCSVFCFLAQLLGGLITLL